LSHRGIPADEITTMGTNVRQEAEKLFRELIVQSYRMIY